MESVDRSWKVWMLGLFMLGGAGYLATGCDTARVKDIERVYPANIDGDQTDELVVFHNTSGVTGLTSLGLEWLEPMGGGLSVYDSPAGRHRWTEVVREARFGSVQTATWQQEKNLVFAANHPNPRVVSYDLEDRGVVWRENFQNHGDSPPSTGHWGHADERVFVAGVQVGERKTALRGFELASGKKRWEHRLQVSPVRPTLQGGQFTESRFVARVSSSDRPVVAVGLESGGLVRLSATSGPWVSDRRILVVRRPNDGSAGERLYELEDGAQEAVAIESDGQPVDVRGRVAGVDDGRLIVLQRRAEQLSGQRYDTIVGLPFEGDAEGFEHRFSRGTYYDPTFVDGWNTDVLSEPFTRTEGRYSSIPLRTSEADGEGRHRIAVFDLDAGEIVWRSENFAGTEPEEVVDYQVTSKEGAQIIVFDKWWENERGGQVAMVLDTRSGEIRGAVGFGEGRASRWCNERAVSNGLWYGAADGAPWALELDEMELRYGPTLELTDATDDLAERLGRLPTRR